MGSEFPCKAQALPPGLALTGSVPLCRLTAAKAQEHARSQSEWKLHFSWKTASPQVGSYVINNVPLLAASGLHF